VPETVCRLSSIRKKGGRGLGAVEGKGSRASRRAPENVLRRESLKNKRNRNKKADRGAIKHTGTQMGKRSLEKKGTGKGPRNDLREKESSSVEWKKIIGKQTRGSFQRQKEEGGLESLNTRRKGQSGKEKKGSEGGRKPEKKC